VGLSEQGRWRVPYGVIHQDIFDSSLSLNHVARWVFQDLVILADSEDNVMMDVIRLALRTRAPIDAVRDALQFLCEPDDGSKSSLAEGRRITPILNPQTEAVIGYHITNRHYYKRLMSRARRREYMRTYRAKKQNAEWEVKRG